MAKVSSTRLKKQNAKQPKQETLQSGDLQDTIKQGSIRIQILGNTPKTIYTSGMESTNLKVPNERYHKTIMENNPQLVSDK